MWSLPRLSRLQDFLPLTAPATADTHTDAGSNGKINLIGGVGGQNLKLRTSLSRRMKEMETESRLMAESLIRAKEELEEAKSSWDEKQRELRDELSKTKLKLASAARSFGGAGVTRASTDTKQLPNLRIFVYDLPHKYNTDLRSKNPACDWKSSYTWQTKYTLEVYMHETLLQSPLRTRNPDEADLFFVPFYLGCYLHSQGTNFFKAHDEIKGLVAWLREKHTYWNANQGRDHVFTFTHDLGGCVADFALLRHSILITNTGELMDRSATYTAYSHIYAPGFEKRRDLKLPCFSPWKDVVAPPMINDKDMMRWHRERSRRGDAGGAHKRNILATFRGTIQTGKAWSYYSRGIRQAWQEKYEFDDKIRITAVHPREGFGKKAKHYQATYRDDFIRSIYCLCPPGWATWTPRLYESLLLGCIPAVVADGNVLPFSRILNYNEFAVHVAEKDASRLKEVLPQDPDVIQRLQAGVDKHWKAFVYNSPPQPGDAFYHIMYELYTKAETNGFMQGFGK